MSDEQGVMTECVYCTKVRPEIGADCPFCEGRRTYFKPAQMMEITDEDNPADMTLEQRVQLYESTAATLRLELEQERAVDKMVAKRAGSN